MTDIHPAKRGLNPWIARKNALLVRAEALMSEYRRRNWYQPEYFELLEELVDNPEARASLPVSTFVYLEDKVGSKANFYLSW